MSDSMPIPETLNWTIINRCCLIGHLALCSEIYMPGLFTKVRRPVWPLDPMG